MRAPGQRLMAHGYVAWLRTIIDLRGKATWVSIVERHNQGHERSRLSAQQVLQEMAQIGLIHICAWDFVPGHKKAIPIPHFAYGPGEPAPHPGFKTGRAKKPLTPRKVRVELIGLKSAIAALQDEELNGKLLAKEIGIGAPAARKLLYALHDHRMVYISEWQRRSNGGVQYPLYSFGLDRKDMPRPARIPVEQHWQRANAARSARRRTLHALGLTKTVRRVQIRDLGFQHSVA